MEIFGFIKKIGKRKKFRMKDAYRIIDDWGRSVMLFFFLILLGSVVGVYIFTNTSNIEASGEHTIEGVTVKIINQELLNETIDHYTLKEERFNELLDNFRGAPQI